MKNKIYLSIIVLLIPLAIISFNKEKKLDLNATNLQDKNTIIVLKNNNEITNIPLEEYVIGVVGAEVPALFLEETLKAQAIASRTFALYQQNHVGYLTLSDQAYNSNDELKAKWQDNYDKYYSKISQAVLDTKDLVLTYNNELIKSYYYSMSNGYTESSITVFNEDLPYLEIIPSTYDNETLNNFSTTITLTQEEFCSKLNISCSNITISNIQKDKSNRIESLIINKQKFLGTTIRTLLNLKSTDFTINLQNNEVTITTKGYGHGVGMSQYGANGMAAAGKNYTEILNYYYKNIKIQKYIV